MHFFKILSQSFLFIATRMEKFKAIIAYLIILVKAKMFCYYRHFDYFPKYSGRTDISFNCVFIRRPFLTRQ